MGTNTSGIDKKNASANKKTSNTRHGSYKKRVKGEFGNLDIAVPRDRESTFELVILPKEQTRFTGFNKKIITLYARGMTTRDILAHLEEIYGVEVSPTLISQVTQAIQEEITLWQNRPLDETPSFISTPSASRCARMAGSSTISSIWLSESPSKASKRFSGFGLLRPREPSSGCRW